MLKENWSSVRLGLLAATFVGALLVWGRITLIPKVSSDAAQTPENTLPESVPLPGWQAIASQPLSKEQLAAETPNRPPPTAAATAAESKEAQEIKMGRRYRYQQGEQTLQADQLYVQSDGNVSRYLFVYSPVYTANATMQVKFQPNVGHYALVARGDRAYLTACINPRGISTVTESQFTQNRYASDLKPERILPWLLGQESLIDSRCLWTLLSVPLPASAAASPNPAIDAQTTKTLETAWVDWHQWWQANFPPPS